MTLLEALTDASGLFDPEDALDGACRNWFLNHATATWDGVVSFLDTVRRLGMPKLTLGDVR